LNLKQSTLMTYNNVQKNRNKIKHQKFMKNFCTCDDD